MGSKSGLNINDKFFRNVSGKLSFASSDFEDYLKKAENAYRIILEGKNPLLYDGDNLMTGWIGLPYDYLNNKLFFINEIKYAAKKFSKNTDIFLSSGIGGSYLGLEAALSVLLPFNYNFIDKKKRPYPKIFFIGNHMSPDETAFILEAIRNKNVGINVISKSGTTIETAVAFRLIRSIIEKRKRKADKIIVTTNSKKGGLLKLMEERGYNKKYFSEESLKLFSISENIGGRYSVTSPVGLFGLAVAGIDIEEFLKGALYAQEKISPENISNIAFTRSALRTLAGDKGAKIENIVSTEKKLTGLTKWCRQLWSESEGKNGKGIWVSSGFYTEDAHSIGQMISGGERNIIETFITKKEIKHKINIPDTKDDKDGLDFLAKQKKDITFINNCAKTGLCFDHSVRGVPVLEYEFDKITPFTLGEFFQYEMNACLISCVMQGINGVTQPDVEGYKKAMYALSGKEGYEDLKNNILKNI
jgi:glucose-6-phosphate isomerase